jgi:hypothetical protein
MDPRLRPHEQICETLATMKMTSKKWKDDIQNLVFLRKKYETSLNLTLQNVHSLF